MACFNGRHLIIGANGLVGRRIGASLTGKSIAWLGTYNKRPANGLIKLDITDQREVKSVFSKASPQVVFHSANLTGGVNFCESHPEKAKEFHLNATKAIGTECKKLNAKLVFISTDYIFDGTRDIYEEGDSPNPLNVYGCLKLETENWIRENVSRFLIIRTTNIYGWDPETVTPNYIMSLYRALKNKQVFNAPSFLFGNPTYVGDLAKAILELCAKQDRGIFHVVGASFLNRFDWANKACEILGLNGSLINEIQKPGVNMIPRPMKSRLATRKFTESFETTLHNLEDGLGLMKEDMRHERCNE